MYCQPIYKVDSAGSSRLLLVAGRMVKNNYINIKINIMCGIIVINKGEKEIETPRQFQEHFGFMPDVEIGHNKIEPDYCLCQCDCEKALNENNIPFKKDCGDIYVGMLDDVVGDDDL